MSKIYVFGIGGTGARVLRSLTMLLSTGVKFGASEIVPVIIDPDNANADLTRTVALMNRYAKIRQSLHFEDTNKNCFFKTGIECKMQNYTLHISGTTDKRFEEFIDYASMSNENKAMARMLFSDKNLKSSMDVGFKGNPNIGSVVLNQIMSSDDFNNFANSFSQGDKIFIISSIFGGTGASGFPLLLKTLRTNNTIPNSALINKATIGALTVLPYFKIKQDADSEIDSATFISKTKSALAYYEKNISQNGQINALYFLADEMENTYENNDGGSAQQNDAHLIELLGATAVVNFSNSTFASTANMELGIKDLHGSAAVSFNDFHSGLRRMLFYPMVQFTLVANALTHKRDYFSSDNFNANKENFKDLYESEFFGDLEAYIWEYRNWLEEMKGNKRSLDLFNLSCNDKPFELVTGEKPKKVFSKLSNYDLVADRFNSSVKKCGSKAKEDKFLEMLFIGTEKLIKEKLKH